MISEEWAKRLEYLNRSVDIGLNIVAAKASGREATDFIIWESELHKANAALSKLEQLW